MLNKILADLTLYRCDPDNRCPSVFQKLTGLYKNTALHSRRGRKNCLVP